MSLTTPPRYTGHAVMLIDMHKTQAFQQTPPGEIDSATVDTQLEIMKSENIALAVVKDLHLDADPEFTSPRPGFVSSAVGLIVNMLTFWMPTNNEPASESVRTRSAAATFQSRMSL